MDTIIHKARAFLQSSQEAKALDLLTPQIQQHPENVLLLQVFGEALLEANDVETAYTVLTKATQLDPEAKLGVEKFLYLGQIIGGQDGCSLLNIAIQRLQDQLQSVHDNRGGDDPVLQELSKLYPTSEVLAFYLIKKLNQAIFAEIEIWMTDLCMEPEAEGECDKLISHSLALDDSNPEAYSLLALIRISQQRQADAEEALSKAWQLFSQKKQDLEVQQNQEGEESSFEYIELVQPLLGLARFAIELGIYDLVPEISSAVAEINDNALDSFYYEALAHSLKAKQLYAQATSSTEDYREFQDAVIIASDNEAIQAIVNDAKAALTQGYRVINSADLEASDPEVVEQVNAMLAEFGGPVMADLMPSRRTADDDEEEGWEDQILDDEN
ncbi:hypothetical protein METBIDRAFT_47346 [Metschnikowia bicuspidata var. bicuspidata NRRL YB-4993]|uniref:Uncharacterized protein n=1 Tax=Metschnikowia bicuspidata var. bicuspidata NRRL YB-4993 TaxID=869754 RepID=A0A1A0H569_9ASCO|nr:hypothetical protein METBIDRAFT_47346 [Metschnikowia bicuspidata var. bicuspidata NRRL YB-4993]OBA19068.1 hypothetical protein METBIDRAFT_47346 [Metschnikowia bicuspidata var. bicuspidata NRRL YB-4993]